MDIKLASAIVRLIGGTILVIRGTYINDLKMWGIGMVLLAVADG